MVIEILHNPRCSKSRQALALLEKSGHEYRIIDYLKTPPTFIELKEILKKLKMKPEGILRKKEAKDAKIGDLSGNELLKAICKNPRALQRPIVVTADKAVIGRPPEAISEVL